jgi:hypothetical protein
MSFLIPTISFATEYCSRTQSDIRQLLEEPTARISFKNAGGFFNGGVCWWHSRLQRSAIYLARFAPEKPKATAKQARGILLALRNMTQTVTIPGYSDFASFTRDHQATAQKILDDWQAYDGVFNAEWRRGISGNYSLPADQLEKRMKIVFDLVKSSPVPVWVMAQMKGITSHSFLILEMVETGTGYDLKVIDSNLPGKIRKVEYKFGQTTVTVIGSKYAFVPYVGFQNDFRLITAAIKATCRGVLPSVMDEFRHIEDGAIEYPRTLQRPGLQ